ncbi:MAG TPA: cytochrome P450 [Acidimicrobiales bacterium]|nr:cytochrome P450 [Acidimicrobiales bacterium]
MTDDLYWDPFDTEIDTDPHPVWRRLRDEAPVYRNERFDFYALSRHADVEAAHRDPKTFSSAHGTVLELMSSDPSPVQMMIFLDPPEHTRLRSLVSRAFTPRRVAEIEDHVRQICAGLLDPLVGSGGFDYLGDFGAVLPSAVISSLMGVPEDEREEVRGHIDQIFHLEPGQGMINDTSFEAMIWLHGYYSTLLEERRRRPADDMISALTVVETADTDGTTRRLGDEEILDFMQLLVTAGTETVARLLGWAAVQLAANPGARAELAADPALLPGAVEELLRHEAPSPVQGRWTTADVELHGTTVPADSKVLLLTGSAGRDERKYPDPDRFDIHRTFDGHVSFGQGIHFCVGAALARLEGRVALEETLTRFPVWEVDHERAVRLHTSTVRGYASVPITV